MHFSFSRLFWPLPSRNRTLLHRCRASVGKRIDQIFRRRHRRVFCLDKPSSKRRESALPLENEFFAGGERRRVIELIEASSSTGCALSDYYLLYNYILLRRPVRVMEFGSGKSSIIMAAAAKELFECSGIKIHIDSLESVESYHREIDALTPAWLRSYISYHYEPVEHGTWNGQFYGAHYRSLPDQGEPYQFVFIDGPTGDANVSIFELMERQSWVPDVVIDRRRITVSCLDRLLRGTPVVAYDYERDLGLVRGQVPFAPRKNPDLPRRIEGVDALDFLRIHL